MYEKEINIHKSKRKEDLDRRVIVGLGLTKKEVMLIDAIAPILQRLGVIKKGTRYATLQFLVRHSLYEVLGMLERRGINVRGIIENINSIGRS